MRKSLSRCTGRALVLIALFPTACPRLNDVPCSTYVSGLQLRGGGDAVRSTAVLKKVASMVDTLGEDEVKPDHSLKRHASRLVLEEAQVSNMTNPTDSTAAPLKEKVLYRIDGKEVPAEVYNSRIKGISQRALEAWISDSDRGGYKEGVDIIVPDHCSSIPEAVARVAHDGTVYIRKGTYKWEGVLVVQKHMHLRGEPNPDEGQGTGRPTLEGRWLLGEKSSGSFKHVNCIARFDGKQGEVGTQ